MKSLIVYYSIKGQNYFGGDIVNIKKGNTEIIAEMIREMTNSDIFELETEYDYPKGYTETTEVAKSEQKQNARPKLKRKLASVDDYDVVFVGYPNWWGTMPMVLFTFLEAYDFSGKKIIPFCTHEGSGIGRSMKDIKNLCPNSIVSDGIDFFGSSVKEQETTVRKWLENMEF